MVAVYRPRIATMRVQHHDSAQPPRRGLTTTEVAQLLRISPDKVRALITSGELGAIDTSNRRRCRRPRFIVLPSHLAQFEHRRRVVEPQAAPRRRKQVVKDFFPDV
jgi:excisionase family DNA binding protein